MARSLLRCLRLPTRLLAAFLLAAVGGCATPPDSKPDVPLPRLVWPEAPETTRIEYVRSFSSSKDLGLTKNFLRRVVDLIFGEAPERLVRPSAVLEVGKIVYVADPGARGVHRFDRGANEYRLIQAEGELPLLSPVGLARGEGDSVYVTDSALAGVYLIKAGAEFATRVPLDQAVAQPTGIAFDAQAKRLYVVDTKAHSIKVFSAQGAYLSSIGQRGEGDGEFNFPTMLWQDAKGRLLVTDSLNFRTQIFDAQGKFIKKFGRMGDSLGDAPRQKGVASDSFGHIYLVDALLNGVQIFDESGQLLLAVGGLGEERGKFWLPAGIFIGGDNTIYVADTYNRRVQVFRYVGGPT